MGIRYHCTNKNCNFPGTGQFEMTLKEETIMDSNNIAVAFCPFCKQEMVFSIFADIPSGTDLNTDPRTTPS